MKPYRIDLSVKSGVLASFQSNPFQADTIFGHLCWVKAHKEGGKGLQDFLAPFINGNPPFILSDGFPADVLPKPLSAERPIKDHDDLKGIKKLEWLSLFDFNRVRNGECLQPEMAASKDLGFELSSSVHNTINRLTYTTASEGGLYSFKEITNPKISIYIKAVSDEWLREVEELFRILSKTGFGKRKSIGKGQFSVESCEPSPFDDIKDANGFVTLSNFCPAKDDPTEGMYKTFVKYGKLGEEFTFCGNPFKKPLLLIKTGSAFKTDAHPRDYYGRMVHEIAPQKPDALQYAYAFTLPIRYPL